MVGRGQIRKERKGRYRRVGGQWRRGLGDWRVKRRVKLTRSPKDQRDGDLCSEIVNKNIQLEKNQGNGTRGKKRRG